MKHHILTLLLALLTLITVSCTSDYRSALPSGCSALVCVNPIDNEVSSRLSFLTDILQITDVKKCGIDFREKIYLFETSDGNFGLCAKVSDDQQLRALLKPLEDNGTVKEGPERQKCNFFIIADKWVCGYTNNSLLVMGPVMPVAQGETMNLMARLLNQDEENSMVGSQMMDKLETLSAPVTIVAQASALPQQAASLLTLGMPKDADASQLVISAEISAASQTVHIAGQPMSFDDATEKALRQSYSAFRPITKKYIQSLGSNALMGFFANFEGKKVLPVLQQSQALLPLLAGVNQAIDMNAIINSIDGDFLLFMPSYSVNGPQLSLAAQLSTTAFLSDVNYWKKSVPQGMMLTDWDGNGYCLQGEDITFFFGTTTGQHPELYGATTATDALASIRTSSTPLDDDIQKLIVGKRLAFVTSISSLLPDGGGIAMMMLPRIMKLKTIVFTIE